LNITERDDFFEIESDYDYELFQVFSNSKAQYNSRVWKVPREEIKEVMQNLYNKGFKIEKHLQKFGINHNNSDKEMKLKTVKIHLEKSGSKMLYVYFNYDEKVLAAVKSLPYRQFFPNKKAWRIYIDDVPLLYEKLQKLDYVDITALEEYYQPEEPIELKPTPKAKITPYKYQLENAQKMLNKKRILNACDMGLGKTIQSILAMNSIDGKKIIICPSSLKWNWEKEIHLIDPDADITILHGKSKWPKLHDNSYVILNYDILNRFIDNIITEQFKVSTFDEAHAIKAVNNNGKPASKRAELSLKIAESTEYCFMLTGTPITNGTRDMFNILKAIKHPLGREFYPFAMKYCGGTKTRFGYDFSGSTNSEELNAKLEGYMIRMLKEDVLELPDKIRSFIPVEVNLSKYNKEIQKYMNENRYLSEESEHLIRITAMRKILALEKVKHTIEMTENLIEQGKPVVIFTNFTSVIDAITEKFKIRCVKVDGNVSSIQRQKNVEKFQNGKADVFVGNIEAAGTGLTLTRSSNVIFNDYSWTPVDHLQAEDRCYRIGQKEKVNIYYMYAQGAEIDQIMTEMLEQKLNNISTIVDGEEQSFVQEILKKL
jgi:SWI/SNF-related matrix-associated actin-dependent regulator of chromatin subfamily A-like protein 1